MLKPEHHKLIEVLSVAGVLGLVIGIARNVVVVRHGTWFNFVAGLIASIVIAIFVGLLLEETNFSITTKAAMIGISAYIAEDLLAVLGNLSQAFRNDPKGFLREGLNMWRNKP